MSLENCNLPRPGADLKGAGMKIPFSPCSLLLEPTRPCLCPWLAAWDVPMLAAPHQDGPAGVQRSWPANPQPGLACRQPLKRASISQAQGWEPARGFPGLCSAGSLDTTPGKQGWEWAKAQNEWCQRSAALDMAPDFLTCKLLPGQNYLFSWRIFSSSLHYVHASKVGINFFSSLGQVRDYPPGRDGNSDLRLKLHIPSNARQFHLQLARHSAAALLC